MATQIQRRRGTTAQHSTFIGALGELTVDTDKKTVVVHDGITAGGFPQALPAGSLIYYAGSVAPAGYLKANGALLSRTTYAALFAAIGTLFGAGDGSATFNLPDLRGEFIRGWDNGRGVDAGRAFGSAQGDAIRNITGYFSGASACSMFDYADGAFMLTQKFGVGVAGDGTVVGYNDVSFNASWAVPTANENRPRNVALLPCIKY